MSFNKISKQLMQAACYIFLISVCNNVWSSQGDSFDPYKDGIVIFCSNKEHQKEFETKCHTCLFSKKILLGQKINYLARQQDVSQQDEDEYRNINETLKTVNTIGSLQDFELLCEKNRIEAIIKDLTIAAGILREKQSEESTALTQNGKKMKLKNEELSKICGEILRRDTLGSPTK